MILFYFALYFWGCSMGLAIKNYSWAMFRHTINSRKKVVYSAATALKKGQAFDLSVTYSITLHRVSVKGSRNALNSQRNFV